MNSEYQKAIIDSSINREMNLSSPGSKSTACNESVGVNVGYPYDSQKDRVSTDKHKSEGVEKVIRKSDWA
tara:strand:+ start:203 stop:412 length:210 start_codon:yes stop_codon:yes gene_type:complete